MSGVYIPGDGIEAPLDKRYDATFSNILAYTFERNHEKGDYFPVIMLGSTLQTFINNRAPQDISLLTQMPQSLVNTGIRLRTTIEPSKSFIFDELQKDTLEEVVHRGSFFNRQRLGLKVKDFEKESLINKRYQVVATINSNPSGRMSSVTDLKVVDNEEYIAILESLDMPLYFILYDVSYSQFVYSERYFSEGQKQLVDHSIAARTHAQYIAS